MGTVYQYGNKLYKKIDLSLTIDQASFLETRMSGYLDTFRDNPALPESSYRTEALLACEAILEQLRPQIMDAEVGEVTQ